jgi:hypothetical protein
MTVVVRVSMRPVAINRGVPTDLGVDEELRWREKEVPA